MWPISNSAGITHQQAPAPAPAAARTPRVLCVRACVQGLKRAIEAWWWDRLRAPATIQSMLQLVYAHKGAADDLLVQRIVAATEHPGAVDAFASIVLSPKGELPFDDMLQALACPVCLAYGAWGCGGGLATVPPQSEGFFWGGEGGREAGACSSRHDPFHSSAGCATRRLLPSCLHASTLPTHPPHPPTSPTHPHPTR